MVNRAEEHIKRLENKWPDYVLKWEEELYFEHRTNIPRVVASELFEGFRCCPYCATPLITRSVINDELRIVPWAAHSCPK